MFAKNDTRLGSKNGENYTLSSGTYPVPKTSKCPLPRHHTLMLKPQRHNDGTIDATQDTFVYVISNGPEYFHL